MPRALLLLVVLAGCGGASAPPPASPPDLHNAPPPRPPQKTDLDSSEILARSTVAPDVFVKHVLLGWKELADIYAGHMDPRAAKRTQEEAARLTEEVAAKVRANPASIDELMDTYSEDPGSATHEPYEVKPDQPFVPEFKNLSLRLAINEVGIVKTRFGYHVIVRVAPEPPDPLESADILARPAVTGSVDVLHILIGWDGLDATRDAIGKQRTKAQADALATELLAKVRAGDDIAALAKQFSDDPGAASSKPYTVDEHTMTVEPFKKLALRLNVGEGGLVKSKFGWHVIQRMAPPPPDPLESVAILQRTTVATRVKVKHILLGWKELNSDDPRGKTRSRAELEALVKKTLKKLAKNGADFDASMAELSEDLGSAKTGEPYEVFPESGLVKPFIDLSLRLQLDEIGVVKTVFGIHIIKRVE